MTMTLSKDQVNEILAESYDDEGVRKWWTNKRAQLGNRTPKEAWADGDQQRVLELAQWLSGPSGAT